MNRFIGLIKIYFLPILIIAVTSFALFYFDNKPVAQSESGLFFYKTKLFSSHKDAWTSFSFGTDGSLVLTLRTYPLIYLLDSNLFTSYQVQFLFFFSLFILSYVGIILNLNLILQNKKSVFFYYLPLIYIYNPFSMFLLLRFQYPFIAFYYSFPLIYFLFYRFKDAETFLKSIRWVFLLNIFITVNSIIYTSLAVIILLNLFFCISIFSYAISKYGLDIKKIFKFLLIKGSLFWGSWIIWNIYWIFPVLIRMKTPVPFSEIYSSTNDNFGNLQYFSNEQSGLLSIFTLVDKNFNSLLTDKYYLYGNLFYFIVVIPIIAFIFALFSNSIKKSFYSIINNQYKFTFLISGIIFFFLLRALRFPLGFIFSYLFNNIRFFQVFRNPFEKFNLVFVFFWTIVFIVCIIYLYNKYTSKRKLVVFIVAIYLIIYHFPLWTGRLFLGSYPPFSSSDYGYRIDVPKRYLDMSNLIAKKDSELYINRSLVLPLAEEGQTYFWKYGYEGAEFIHYYLSNSAIAMVSGTEVQTFLVKNLKNEFPFIIDKAGYLKMLGFNDIVWRNDIDWVSRGLIRPTLMDKYLQEGYGYDFSKKISLMTSLDFLLVGNDNPNQSKYISKENLNYIPFLWNNDKNGLKIEYVFNKDDFKLGSNYVSFVFEFDEPKKIISIKEAKINGFKESKKNNKTKITNFNSSFELNPAKYICNECYVSTPIQISKFKKYTSLSFILRINEPKSSYTIKDISYITGDFNRHTKFTNFESIESDGSVAKIYEIEGEPLKHLGAVSQVEYISNYQDLIYKPKIDYLNTAYLYDNKFNKNRLKDLNKIVKADIDYKKINNGEYVFKLKESELLDNKENKVFLTFPNSFDPLWKIYREDETFLNPLNIRNKNLFGEFQFIVNTYSNGWLINLDDVNFNSKSSYRLVYIPQLLYEKLFPVSISFLIILLVLSLLSFFNLKANKND